MSLSSRPTPTKEWLESSPYSILEWPEMWQEKPLELIRRKRGALELREHYWRMPWYRRAEAECGLEYWQKLHASGVLQGEILPADRFFVAELKFESSDDPTEFN